MSRLSCAQNYVSPDFSEFEVNYVQIFLRSLEFADRVILNSRCPLERLSWSIHFSFLHETSAWEDFENETN